MYIFLDYPALVPIATNRLTEFKDELEWQVDMTRK